MDKKKLGTCIFLGLVAGMFLFMNFRIIYITDDWHFMFVFGDFLPGENAKRVQSLSDVFASMKDYYLGSGGRVLSHTILSIMLMMDKWVFNILNTIVYFSTGFLMYALIKEKKNSAIILIPINILLIFYLPLFGETCLWMSGSVNYLWMAVLSLSFVVSIKKKKTGLSFLLAILTGFTNEATGGMMIVFIISQILFKKEKLDVVNILRMLLVIPGELFILLSPGNAIRAEEISKTKVFSIEVAIDKLGETIRWIVDDGYYVLIIPIIVILVIYRKKIDRLFDSISYLLVSLAGMVALALSGTFIMRAHFLNVIFLIMSFASAVLALIELVSEKLEEKQKNGYGKALTLLLQKSTLIKTTALLMVSLFVVGFLGLNAYQFVNATSDDLKQIEMIENAAKSGTDIEYHPVMHYRQGLFYPWEASNSKEYEAAWQSEYYGIEIKVTDTLTN